jgi:hypothetical protein
MKTPTATKVTASSHRNGQWQSVIEGIDNAIDWVNKNRRDVTRLNIEADYLVSKLRRSRNKAYHLGELSPKETAIGFTGLAQAGKSSLICALSGGEQGQLEVMIGGKTLDYLTQVNPGNRASVMATRFTRQSSVKNSIYPVNLTLLNECDIGKMLISVFLHDHDQRSEFDELDSQQLTEHLDMLVLHRQSEPVAGMTSADVVSLWDFLLRYDKKRQKQLNTHFWPVAIELAPYLNIDERARLFSPLWDDNSELTADYRRFAHTLQNLGNTQKLQAPLSILVDDALQPADGIINDALFDRLNSANDTLVQVRPIINGRVAKVQEVALAELAFLTAELQLPLVSPPSDPLFEQVDLLDIPGYSGHPTLRERSKQPRAPKISHGNSLLRAKRAYLIDRYSENQQLDLLLVCSAAGNKGDIKPSANLLDHWVKQTQSITGKARRKPALIWALTKLDFRLTQGQNFDDAVQRYIGNQGDSWGTMLVMDKGGIKRMVTYLSGEIRREIRQQRLDSHSQELQRDLVENQLSGWSQSAGSDDVKKKQRIAKSLLKVLQARTGVHGELLEHLLPPREALRHLYLQQQTSNSEHLLSDDEDARPALSVANNADPFGIGISLDLLADEPEVITQEQPNTSRVTQGYEAEFAAQVQYYWVNHLRNLPENQQLIDLLAVDKPTLEMLVEEFITASVRQNIAGALLTALTDNDPFTLNRETKADRQVSRVLTILGDFVAWLGFQKISEAKRPESRINPGHKIFCQPQKQAGSWNNGLRLTKLTLAPTNNTAFYIYDWLVGLNEMIRQNAGYAAGREISDEQRKQLIEIINKIKPTTAAVAEPA